MAIKKEYVTLNFPKTLIVGIHAPTNKTKYIDSYFQEFMNLVRSNRGRYDHALFINLRQIDPRYFVTLGKMQEIKELCEKEKIEEVIFSEQLSVQQERNLAQVLHARIFDRTRLILEIFEKAATSAEGKLQIQIAMLQFDKSRLAGQGIFLSQQAGQVGTRGPGETLKERETRHIENTILKYKQQLQKIEKSRQVQRKNRVQSQIPLMCLIGYTNAGKSTILNALTKSDVLAEDKLFATLDTTTRKLYIDGAQKGLLSDTVGFVQQLPHQLIEAFKSTLAELQYAHLLLHVVDISDPNWQGHIKVVHEILKQLGLENKDMLYIFNKADKANVSELKSQVDQYQPHVITNASSKEGLADLINFLRTWQIKKNMAV